MLYVEIIIEIMTGKRISHPLAFRFIRLSVYGSLTALKTLKTSDIE